MKKVRGGWPEDDLKVVDDTANEVLSIIEKYPSAIASAFEDVTRMAKDDQECARAVYEAESRSPWDALILQFYGYADGSGYRRML